MKLKIKYTKNRIIQLLLNYYNGEEVDTAI